MTGPDRMLTPTVDNLVRRSLVRHHVVWSAGPVHLRFRRRSAVVAVGLVVGIVLSAAIGLTLGDYGIPPGEILATLRGRASDPLAAYFVTGVRAPRVVTAVLVGAGLGLSGAVFQILSGNPLGSPDIIGFSAGAATGALVQIIVVGGDTTAVAVGAVLGGLAAAAVVYGLAWRGGVSGYRLVLVGIGVGAALQAVNALLVVRASLVAAQTAAQWLAGSLNAALWPRATVLAVALAVLAVIAIGLARPLAVLPLGDVVTTGLGVRVQSVRLVAVAVGVLAVSVATATTGPVAFVALAAPHLTRRVARTPVVGLVGAALMGALLVLASDIVAQRVLAPTQLAVGVVTGALGGLYLVALLATEWRSRRG